MKTYIILSRFSPNAFTIPKEFRKLAADVSERIQSECPGIVWQDSYATLGRFDVVDIVKSDNPRQVEKAAMIIRGYGHSVRRQNSDFELSTDVFGETIDPERHSLTVDVKAVTLHRFQVIQITKGWKVTVISVIQCGSCRIRVMMNRAGLHV